MAEVKFKKKESISRAEAAARLSEVAKALGSGDVFELERGGETLKLDVADQVTLEIEVEIEDDETELEFELKWSNKPESDPQTAGIAAEAQAEPMEYPLD